MTPCPSQYIMYTVFQYSGHTEAPEIWWSVLVTSIKRFVVGSVSKNLKRRWYIRTTTTKYYQFLRPQVNPLRV